MNWLEEELGYPPKGPLRFVVDRFANPGEAWRAEQPNAEAVWFLAATRSTTASERALVLGVASDFVGEKIGLHASVEHRPILQEMLKQMVASDTGKEDAQSREKRLQLGESWDQVDYEQVWGEDYYLVERAKTVEDLLHILFRAFENHWLFDKDEKAPVRFKAAIGQLAESWTDMESRFHVDTDQEIEEWNRIHREVAIFMRVRCPFVEARL